MLARPITRRTAAFAITGLAVSATLGMASVKAAEKSVTVGINLSLTGADAEFRQADRVWSDDGV